MANICWVTYSVSVRPKIVHNEIDSLEFQRQVDPENVTTTINSTNVMALSIAPTQSICNSLYLTDTVGCGL